MYKQAVETLADKDKTTLILVSRPEDTPLKEAERASFELSELGIKNQMLIINGVMQEHDDEISNAIYHEQHKALSEIPQGLKNIETFEIPLRPYNITGLENVRALLKEDHVQYSQEVLKVSSIKKLNDIVDDIYDNNKKVIFTMGKGGVGKTTVAAAIAIGLAKKGKKVHLTTTDPAGHLKYVLDESYGITLSNIEEKEELEKYKNEVLNKALKNNMTEEDIEYIEEDLRSPCTQEIAVFRAFADIVKKSDDEIVVIDTAPTGHTLLLLESTENYNREISRSEGDIPQSVIELLPKLKDNSMTEVVIVTLPEATPVYEAVRLKADLDRAQIYNKWWVINSSLYKAGVTNKILKVKALNEVKWINKVNEVSRERFAIIDWKSEEVKGDNLIGLLK